MSLNAVSSSLTRQRLAEDRRRIREALARRADGPAGRLALHPTYQAAWLHRWSHYHFCRGNRLTARLLWHLNLLLTGVDISPMSDLGGGLVILHPAGTILVGNAGQNLTVHGRSGFGGGLQNRDVGAGPGLPVLGADVVIEFGACVLGPVMIGDGAIVRAGAIVHRNLPAGAVEPSPVSRAWRSKGRPAEAGAP